MHKNKQIQSGLTRLVLFVVYIAFFAVQLNLKYDFISYDQMAQLSNSKLQSGNSSSFILKESADHSKTIVSKINKRYYPSSVYDIPTAYTVVPDTTTIRLKVFFKASCYHPCFFITSIDLRGPPAEV